MSSSKDPPKNNSTNSNNSNNKSSNGNDEHREYQDAQLQELQHRVNQVYHHTQTQQQQQQQQNSTSSSRQHQQHQQQEQQLQSSLLQLPPSYTPNQTVVQNMTITAGADDEPSYDYYMEVPGLCGVNGSMAEGTVNSRLLAVANHNHNGADDTFEDLWQDELTMDASQHTNTDGSFRSRMMMGDYLGDDTDADTVNTRFSTGTSGTAGNNTAGTDDASLDRISIQRMIWKANAVQAALAQQQQDDLQDQQQAAQVGRKRPPTPPTDPPATQPKHQLAPMAPTPTKQQRRSPTATVTTTPSNYFPSHDDAAATTTNDAASPLDDNDNAADATPWNRTPNVEDTPNNTHVSQPPHWFSPTSSANSKKESPIVLNPSLPDGGSATDGSPNNTNSNNSTTPKTPTVDALQTSQRSAASFPNSGGSRPPLPLRERNDNTTNNGSSPSNTDVVKSPLPPQSASSYNYNNSTPIQLLDADDYQVIQRSNSSPPDPPSHRFIPSSQLKKYVAQQKQKQQQQQRSSPPYKIPAAVAGGSYYDPEEEQDALTNLVITVVGLEDDANNNGDDQDARRSNSKTARALLPPSIGNCQDDDDDNDNDDDEEENISFVSRFDDEGATENGDHPNSNDDSRDFSVSNSRPAPYSFQTLFLTADATSGIFFATFLMLWVPLVVMGMISWELFDTTQNPLVEWRTFLGGVPMNEDVSTAVRVTQICFLLGWVLLVKQTAFVNTTIHLLSLVGSRGSARRQSQQQLQRSNGNKYANMSYLQRSVVSMAAGTTSISKGRWLLGSSLEWMKYLLYMVNAVIVLIQATDSVMMLLWNMAALEFVSRLDALAFQVWTRGKHQFLNLASDSGNKDTSFSNALVTPSTAANTDPASPGMVSSNNQTQNQSNHIHSRSQFSFPEQSSKQPVLRIVLYFLISGSILLAYGWIVYEQVLGHPVVTGCDAMLIQFGEIVNNGFVTTSIANYYYASIFSGIYLVRQGKFSRHHGRNIYDLTTASKTEEVKHKLAYCRSLEAWTVSRGNLDPCKDYLLRTGPTHSYDLLSMQGEYTTPGVTWFVSSREEADSISYDAPLDWFQFACADCTKSSQGSQEAFGYHCTQSAAQVASSKAAVVGAAPLQAPVSMPCATLTWDTRSQPFPDVFSKLRSGTTDDEATAMMGGVDPKATFEIMVDAYGSVLLEPQLQRPVYASHFESQLVLLVFVGRRWVVVILRDTFEEWKNHPERHLDKISTMWAYWNESPIGDEAPVLMASAYPAIYPMFVSELVDLSVSVAGELAPLGLKWNNIRQEEPSTAVPSLLVGSALETTLLCTACDEAMNPCHSGGFCDHTNAGGGSTKSRSQCLCRPGYEGHLCESSSLGCQKGKLGVCHHDGSCVEGACQCPTWERNRKAHQIRGDVCQLLPNCFDFELEGIDCFERGTCSNVGCDNGSVCTMDGTCDCDSPTRADASAESGKFRGKLCQERVNCFDYEEEGQDCIANGTCSNKVCNGGVCSADGSCMDCPVPSVGWFCQVLPDCFNLEIGGSDSDCFKTGRCTNAGCANGGTCQRDGSCACTSRGAQAPDADDIDPFDEDDDNVFGMEDDDTLVPASGTPSVLYSGKLCQIRQKPDKVSAATSTQASNTPASVVQSSCEMSACAMNGGECLSSGMCICPVGLTGEDCGIALACWEGEVGGQDCVAAGTCTNKACHSRSGNSTCSADGKCECPAMFDVELYGNLCQTVFPIDNCYEAEADGRECFKKGTCSNAGCSNGGGCTEDGTCDCSSLFWGKNCQHGRDCFEQEYSCFFNTFLTGGAASPGPGNNSSESPCSDAGCLNSGICQASGSCLCPNGYDGKVCEEEL